MTNRRIGHFELMDLLGEGAMGRVYRARDVNLDRTVALKFLSDRTLGDTTYFERFKREARLAASLNHPNIATIYAYGEEKGEAYIAMEFVEGQTLGDVIKERGALPVAEVQKYGRQAATALALAHSRGIIHRDIKPANLMINTEGDLKVMDFGVARRSGETEITMAGSIIGTANIMAPELIQGGEITSAADLFSLGCVLYEALAGRRAFEGDDPMAVFYQIVNATPKPLAAARPDAPPALLEVIDGLLRKEPEARFGPAQAVADALADGGGGTRTLPFDQPEVATMVLGEEAATAIRDTVVVPPKPAPFWKRPRVWAAVSLLVTGMGLWGVFGRGGSDPVVVDAAGAIADNNRAAELVSDMNTADEAIRLLEQAGKKDPTLAPVENNLGLAWQTKKKPDQAKEHFERAIRLDPDYAVPHIGLGDVLWDLGKTDDAVDHYRKAIRLATASEDQNSLKGATNNLSSLLVTVNRHSEALEILQPAVEQFPQVAALRKNLGLAYLGVGELDSAEVNLNRARDLPGGEYFRAAIEEGLRQIAAAPNAPAPD